MWFLFSERERSLLILTGAAVGVTAVHKHIQMWKLRLMKQSSVISGAPLKMTPQTMTNDSFPEKNGVLFANLLSAFFFNKLQVGHVVFPQVFLFLGILKQDICGSFFG